MKKPNGKAGFKHGLSRPNLVPSGSKLIPINAKVVDQKSGFELSGNVEWHGNEGKKRQIQMEKWDLNTGSGVKLILINAKVVDQKSGFELSRILEWHRNERKKSKNHVKNQDLSMDYPAGIWCQTHSDKHKGFGSKIRI